MAPPVFSLYDDFVYEELQRLLFGHDLILFAGAGLSAQACTDDGRHPPMWSDLLRKMALWCHRARMIQEDHMAEIIDSVDRGFPLDTGQELVDILDPSSLQRCLGEVLFYNLVRTSEAHSLVARMPFRAYVTTNYDDLIESAYHSENGVTLRKLYEKTSENMLNFYRSRDPFIFKLHGDISDPGAIVLGNRSYSRLLYTDATYRSRIESLFATSSVLFIGYGGTDPNLDVITTRVASFDGRSKRHWMLVPEDSCPPVRARRLWADRGINVISYVKDESHTAVAEFLRRLSPNSGGLKLASELGIGVNAGPPQSLGLVNQLASH